MNKSLKKQNIDLIFRTIRFIRALMPGYLFNTFLLCICESTMPFIDIYFSARIIDEVSTTRDINVLLKLLVYMVCFNFIVAVIYKYAYGRNRIFEAMSGEVEESFLNKKSFVIEYQFLEDAAIKGLRQRIVDNRNRGGIRITIVCIRNIFESIISAVISIVMMAGILCSHTDDYSTGIERFANSKASVVLLLLLMAVSLIALVKITYSSDKNTYAESNLQSLAQRVSHYYIDDYLNDSKAGKDIHVFNQKNLIIKTIKRVTEDFIRIEKNIGRIGKKQALAQRLTEALLYCYVYFVVTVRTVSGSFGFGTMIENIGLLGEFLTSVSQVSTCFVKLWSNCEYLRDFYSFVDLPDDIVLQEKSGKTERISKIKTFEFCNVSFKYPNANDYALKDISFTINNGEHIAIVGENGSGKTTLIKLLCRFYAPNSGVIKLNHFDISNYPKEEYYRKIATVFQDYRLLPLSIGENVATSSVMDRDKVINCLEEVGMMEKINAFPHDIDESVFKIFADEGIEMSGGESQKIAIARALYKEAPILILDEPTASIDPISEYEIFSRLNRIAINKTTIFISHRLSACRFCDRIIVMDKGKVVQIGTHDELLAQEKKYRELWNAQAKYYIQKGE